MLHPALQRKLNLWRSVFRFFFSKRMSKIFLVIIKINLRTISWNNNISSVLWSVLSITMLFLESVKELILTGGCEYHFVCWPSFVSTRWGGRCVNSNLFRNEDQTLTSKLCFAAFKITSEVTCHVYFITIYATSHLILFHASIWNLSTHLLLVLFSVTWRRRRINKIYRSLLCIACILFI